MNFNLRIITRDKQSFLFVCLFVYMRQKNKQRSTSTRQTIGFEIQIPIPSWKYRYRPHLQYVPTINAASPVASPLPNSSWWNINNCKKTEIRAFKITLVNNKAEVKTEGGLGCPHHHGLLSFFRNSDIFRIISEYQSFCLNIKICNTSNFSVSGAITERKQFFGSKRTE